MINLRTGYSFRSAFGKIETILDQLVKQGRKFAPITDRSSTYGWTRWVEESTNRGLTPVLGVELGVSPDIVANRPVVDWWTFLPVDGRLEPLTRLIATATEQFRYQPMLTYAQALEPAFNAELLAVPGRRCLMDGYMPESIPEEAALYFPSGPHVSYGLHQKFLEIPGAKFTATLDNYFPFPEDRAAYQVTCGKGASDQTWPQHIMNDNAWKEAVYSGQYFDGGYKLIEKAWDSARLLLELSSRAQQKHAQLPRPANLPKRSRPDTYLKKLCIRGLKTRGLADSQAHRERMDRELKMIAEKNFSDYFLIVADIVHWAKERMIVGPARGSAAGSLVCYLLEITEIDPLKFGLIFERFIDLNRADLPDIDIDFSYQHRESVIRYIGKTYGQDNVSRLGTVAMFKPRSIMAEVGRELKVPKWEVEAFLDSILVRSSGDARAMDTLGDSLTELQMGKELVEKYPEIWVGTKMEGHPRHSSQHASAVVLSESPPLHHLAPVDQRNGCLMMDKKDAEKLDLLKVDALGLTQLSILEDAMQMAGQDKNDLLHIDLEDPHALSILQDHRYSGIFQFNGIALQNVAKQVPFDRFDDIVAVTALSRPGPIVSGGTTTWCDRRLGYEPVEYPHPVFEPYLSETYGVIIYQEQIMTIGREVGGLSWDDVTELRKAMSKSLGEEYFDQFGDRWKAGAEEKGVPRAVLDELWKDMCAYGSWSFNKSHAVSYGLISYWCCWVKSRFPFEFAAATLNHEDDIERQLEILRELDQEGYNYKPVDLEKSIDRWTIDQASNTLIGPLGNIRGIGPKFEERIMSYRKAGRPLPPSLVKKLTGARTPLDSLYPIRDAIKLLCPDPQARNIITPPIEIADVKWYGQDDMQYPVVIMCTVKKINVRDENEPIKVAKRGGPLKDGSPTQSLNLHLIDDTDTVFAKINRFDFERLGRDIVTRGKEGSVLYAFKGVPLQLSGSFRMFKIDAVRFLGEFD